MTTSEPRIEERPERPYVAVRADLTMAEIEAGGIGRLIEEVAASLERRGLAPSGPPLARYHVIDMAAKLELEVGFPVSDGPPGDGRVRSGVLPAGRYAILVYSGGDGVAGNRALIDWAAAEGLAWDDVATDRGHGFRGRVESFLTDPTEEPDPSRWETEVAILLRSPA